jgi:hypothetical protein
MFSSDDFYSNQNTHSANYLQDNNKQIRLILLLLEKAEQILSILNLPDSAIQKYNKLKEITFSKCSLEFHPLIKKNQNNNNSSPSNNSTLRSNINNKTNTTFVSDLSTISTPHINLNQTEFLKNINLKKII